MKRNITSSVDAFFVAKQFAAVKGLMNTPARQQSIGLHTGCRWRKQVILKADLDQI